MRAARRLGHERDVGVVTTFLGAHALPPEANDKDKFIDDVAGARLQVGKHAASVREDRIASL